MLILDATTKSLKVVLAGAVATTQLPVVAHYTDITTTAYTPGSNDTVTNSTTAVEFVAAPAASTQRHVESISVYNVDTASATVTIQYVSAGGTRQIIKVVLLTLETLIYEDGYGWQSIDANGQIKLSASSDKVSHSLATAVSDMLFASGVGQFIKKTLAEGRTLLGLDGATTTIAVGGGTGVAPVWTTATGTGAPVRATSPTLVTPLLGTPTSGVLTNATGLPLAGLVPGTAESDFICATTTPFTWVKKTLAEAKTILGLLSDVPAATAESDFIVAGASPFAWIKKTLVEAKALLGLVITAGKTITCTQNTDLDEAVPMSSKAPKDNPTFTGVVTASTISRINQTNAIENTSKLLQTEDIISDFVVTGLLPATSANLISDISAGHAYVTGVRVNKAVTSKTYTASVDTYVDVNSAGTYTFPEVALGAAAPAITADSIRLAKVVTAATAITSVTDLRTSSLAIIVNGSERMRINSAGNVGIGTTSPGYKLDVIQSGANAGVRISGGTNPQFRVTDGTIHAKLQVYTGGNTVLFGTESNHPTSVYTDNLPRVTILGNGNVGIGTTSPTAVLHLKAGTAAANTAPLKFTSGALLTTPEAGAMEFLTDAYYGTITTGAARKTFAFLESPIFTTPALGTPTSGVMTNVTGLPSAGLTVGAKTHTVIIPVPDPGGAGVDIAAGYILWTPSVAVTITKVYTAAETAWVAAAAANDATVTVTNAAVGAVATLNIVTALAAGSNTDMGAITNASVVAGTNVTIAVTANGTADAPRQNIQIEYTTVN
uniref:Putative tail collar domain protein n=1 Tax=viral metagenome TaxID=1070528 RepID=A0A6M3K7W2_9ZZZZ